MLLCLTKKEITTLYFLLVLFFREWYKHSRFCYHSVYRKKKQPHFAFFWFFSFAKEKNTRPHPFSLASLMLFLLHRKAEGSDLFPKLEILSVGEGGKVGTVQVELSRLVHQRLIHVHGNHVR